MYDGFVFQTESLIGRVAAKLLTVVEEYLLVGRHSKLSIDHVCEMAVARILLRMD